MASPIKIVRNIAMQLKLLRAKEYDNDPKTNMSYY